MLYSSLFDAGFYPTRRDVGKKLESEINELLKQFKIKVYFVAQSDTCFSWWVEGGTIGIFSNDNSLLQGVLGFELRRPVQPESGVQVSGISNLSEAVSNQNNFAKFNAHQQVDLYCDILAKRITGSMLTNSLGVIDATHTIPGQTICSRPANLIYYPILTNSFNQIETRVCDQTGNEVEFSSNKSDRVTYELHLRQTPFTI